MGDQLNKTISVNRKARHDYSFSDEYEAGMVLVGSEVKSIRSGGVNLKDAYASIKNNEVWVHNMHISPYPYAYYGNHDPFRIRKLLLHKSEIKKLIGKTTEKGLAMIPMSLYFKNGKIKMKLGLGKGKRMYDKRQSLKNREADREMHRVNKHHDY